MGSRGVGTPAPSVLLVDDDPDVLESIRAFIETSLPGVRLVTARSGNDALVQLQRGGFALIVTDYKMPGMDGIELLRRAAKIAPAMGRIMITAYPDPEVAARAVQEGGASLLITKPFDPEYFVEVVRALVKTGAKAVPSP